MAGASRKDNGRATTRPSAQLRINACPTNPVAPVTTTFIGWNYPPPKFGKFHPKRVQWHIGFEIREYALSSKSTPSASAKKSPNASRSTRTSADRPQPAPQSAPIPSVVSESAQQIWQAGLGAFTRAQLEGSKTFETLVREGVEFQRKTQEAAEQKISEATHRINDFATQLSGSATGQWGRLSTIFEDRVGRALEGLGVPTAAEVAALTARIEALENALKTASVTTTQAPAPAKRTKGTT